MMKLTHPRFPGITREVPDASAQDWIKAGWKKQTQKTTDNTVGKEKEAVK